MTITLGKFTKPKIIYLILWMISDGGTISFYAPQLRLLSLNRKQKIEECGPLDVPHLPLFFISLSVFPSLPFGLQVATKVKDVKITFENWVGPFLFLFLFVVIYAYYFRCILDKFINKMNPLIFSVSFIYLYLCIKLQKYITSTPSFLLKSMDKLNQINVK